MTTLRSSVWFDCLLFFILIKERVRTIGSSSPPPFSSTLLLLHVFSGAVLSLNLSTQVEDPFWRLPHVVGRQVQLQFAAQVAASQQSADHQCPGGLETWMSLDLPEILLALFSMLFSFELVLSFDSDPRFIMSAELRKHNDAIKELQELRCRGRTADLVFFNPNFQHEQQREQRLGDVSWACCF